MTSFLWNLYGCGFPEEVRSIRQNRGKARLRTTELSIRHGDKRTVLQRACKTWGSDEGETWVPSPVACRVVDGLSNASGVVCERVFLRTNATRVLRLSRLGLSVSRHRTLWCERLGLMRHDVDERDGCRRDHVCEHARCIQGLHPFYNPPIPSKTHAIHHRITADILLRIILLSLPKELLPPLLPLLRSHVVHRVTGEPSSCGVVRADDNGRDQTCPEGRL